MGFELSVSSFLSIDLKFLLKLSVLLDICKLSRGVVISVDSCRRLPTKVKIYGVQKIPVQMRRHGLYF